LTTKTTKHTKKDAKGEDSAARKTRRSDFVISFVSFVLFVVDFLPAARSAGMPRVRSIAAPGARAALSSPGPTG
jgi:hypothetical protein